MAAGSYRAEPAGDRVRSRPAGESSCRWPPETAARRADRHVEHSRTGRASVSQTPQLLQFGSPEFAAISDNRNNTSCRFTTMPRLRHRWPFHGHVLMRSWSVAQQGARRDVLNYVSLVQIIYCRRIANNVATVSSETNGVAAKRLTPSFDFLRSGVWSGRGFRPVSGSIPVGESKSYSLSFQRLSIRHPRSTFQTGTGGTPTGASFRRVSGVIRNGFPWPDPRGARTPVGASGYCRSVPQREPGGNVGRICPIAATMQKSDLTVGRETDQ